MSSVSLCLPTYNGAAYLAEAIRSVLAQTFTDFEFIIVDDQSTDESATIARSFNDRRVTFHQNPTRLGLVENWNRCLDLARGEYVCIFHQDDVMLPHNLAAKVEALAQNPAAGLVYSNVYLIDADGRNLAESWFFPTTPSHDFVESGSIFFERLLLGDNLVACPSVMVRRVGYEKRGRFDPRFRFTADLNMWLRLLLAYDIVYLAQPLVKYRWHHSNESHNFSETGQWAEIYEAKMAVFNDCPGQIPRRNVLLKTFQTQYKRDSVIRALHHIRHRDYQHGSWYFKFAVADQKFSGECLGLFLKSLLAAGGLILRSRMRSVLPR
ncbi:MAG TPA: glycosyltransferase [Anaerolineae bacterium]|nr:glycosyltransferase [Anaerolineae bacterium]HMR66952.1 glycosyltransferase [Anaerolineae bacterium]